MLHIHLLKFDDDLRNRHLSSFQTIFNSEDKKITIFSEAHEFHYLSAYQIFLDNKFIGTDLKVIDMSVVRKNIIFQQ